MMFAACGGGGGGSTPGTDGGSGSGSGSGIATAACGSAWNFTQPSTCDLPCVDKPEAHGPQCDGFTTNGQYRDFCLGTFTLDGKMGCCDSTHRQDSPSMPVYFVACQ